MLLSGDDDGLLTGPFGLALWSLLPFPDVVDLTLPRDGKRPERSARKPVIDVRVHRPNRLPETTLRMGLRTATVPFLLLEAAANGPREELVTALEQAFVDRRTSTESLEAFIAARAGQRVTRRLAELVSGPRTRSELERIFLRLLREARLPPPDSNKEVNGHLVDFVWWDLRVIVETDGWGAHGSRRAFERDRHRDLDHRVAGWTVIRITSRMLEREPHAVLARLGAVLLAAA